MNFANAHITTIVHNLTPPQCLKDFCSKLKTELGEAAYNAAWERGKSLDLDTVIQELLAEFEDSIQ